MRREDLRRLYVLLMTTIIIYSIAYLIVFHVLCLSPVDPQSDRMFLFVTFSLILLINILFPWAVEVLPE